MLARALHRVSKHVRSCHMLAPVMKVCHPVPEEYFVLCVRINVVKSLLPTAACFGAEHHCQNSSACRAPSGTSIGA